MTEEMQDLLGKYFSGEATPEETRRVEQWVAAGASNKDEFDLLKKLWNKSDEASSISFDTDRAWEKVNAKINPAASKGKKVVMQRAIISIAASIILVLGIWWMLADKTNMQTVVADVAVKEVLLKDGSKVYLRKGSALTYPETFAGNNREVTLNGQAFFEVEPNAAKPFIITAAATTVQVVGTSFSVNTSNNQVELIVKTGRVNFTPLGDTSRRMLVVAGERATWTGDTIQRIPNTDINFDAWQTGKMDFADTPLRDIFRTLNDYYQVNIKLDPKEPVSLLDTEKITITFNREPLQDALRQLEMISSLRVKKLDETEYEVSKK